MIDEYDIKIYCEGAYDLTPNYITHSLRRLNITMKGYKPIKIPTPSAKSFE